MENGNRYESLAQKEAAAIDYAQLYPDAVSGINRDSTDQGTVIFMRALKQSWLRHKLIMTFFTAGLLGSSVVLGIVTNVSWGGSAFLLLLGVLVVWALVVHTRSQDDFWQQFAQHRGLQLEKEETHPGSDVPLLNEGDERKLERVCTGRIGTAEGRLYMYTYIEVTYDGEGRKSESNFPFSVVELKLPAAVARRYPGVDLKRIILRVGSGKLLDGFSSDRGVELESIAFNKRYRLRVLDEQDNIALYELFSTPFIDYLAQECEVNWQQRGDTLVCYWPDHTNDPDLLDVYVNRAVQVHNRYLEEHQ